jgi:hypothetical protein
MSARLTGHCCVAGSIYTCTCARCKCRLAGWHGHAHLVIGGALVGAGLGGRWFGCRRRPVVGGSLDHEGAKMHEGTKREDHEARRFRGLRASCLRAPSCFRDPNACHDRRQVRVVSTDPPGSGLAGIKLCAIVGWPGLDAALAGGVWLPAVWCHLALVGAGVIPHARTPGNTCTCVRCKCRPADWHGHARLHLRQVPVSIDLAAPWRPVDGAGRSVRACQPR